MLIAVEIPPLEDLYIREETQEIIEIKWKILGWTMSLSADVIATIRKLPKHYVVVGTILCVLVEV